jgi:hypothetical protein
MNRTLAIILTVLCVLLCGCPGLFYFGLAAFFWPNAASMADQLAQIERDSGISWSLIGGGANAVLLARVLVLVLALLFIVIPIVVGLITFRLSKKKTAALPPTT